MTATYLILVELLLNTCYNVLRKLVKVSYKTTH